MRQFLILLIIFFSKIVCAQDAIDKSQQENIKTEDSINPKVYINILGTMYHLKECGKINSKYYPISLQDALEEGYEPCRLCNPPTEILDTNGISLMNAPPLVFTEIVYVDSGINKNVLFERARAYLNDIMNSYQDVSQIQDKETGELSIKGIFYKHINGLGSTAYYTDYCYLKFKLSIWVKDGRYKYEFSDFYDDCLGVITEAEIYPKRNTGKLRLKYFDTKWNTVKKITITDTQSLINQLKTTMAKSIKKDDW